MAFKPFCKDCQTWHDEAKHEKSDVCVWHWHITRSLRLMDQSSLAWHDGDANREFEQRKLAEMHLGFSQEIQRLRQVEQKFHWLLRALPKLEIDTIPGDSIEVTIHAIRVAKEWAKYAELNSALRALNVEITNDRQLR